MDWGVVCVSGGVEGVSEFCHLEEIGNISQFPQTLSVRPLILPHWAVDTYNLIFLLLSYFDQVGMSLKDYP